MIGGEEFDVLLASIRANGLRETIVLHNGMALDGRNRQHPCQAAGFECHYDSLPGGADPVQFVIDKNLKRRHRNDDQRRMVATKLANMGRNRQSKHSAECGIEIADAGRTVSGDTAGTLWIFDCPYLRYMVF